MQYKIIGMMSGSSLDGLDIAYVHLHEQAGKWQFSIEACDCYAYDEIWIQKLRAASTLSTYDYMRLDAAFGAYLARHVRDFIAQHELAYRVDFLTLHGHTTFHAPQDGISCQLGSGAQLSAHTSLPVITDLRNMDIVFGGQGAPLVPIGERALFGDTALFLNLGGIANISLHTDTQAFAFDVCAANAVLNFFAQKCGRTMDENGDIARSGQILKKELEDFLQLPYFSKTYPKSLANEWGFRELCVPLLDCVPADALRTLTELIALQIAQSIKLLLATHTPRGAEKEEKIKMMITGGGAYNTFLVERLRALLPSSVALHVPDDTLIRYKEALIMAFMGALRWRTEYNTIASVTGARQASVGGALWWAQNEEVQ